MFPFAVVKVTSSLNVDTPTNVDTPATFNALLIPTSLEKVEIPDTLKVSEILTISSSDLPSTS